MELFDLPREAKSHFSVQASWPSSPWLLSAVAARMGSLSHARNEPFGSVLPQEGGTKSRRLFLLSSALSDSVLAGADRLLLLLGFPARALAPGLPGARCSCSTTWAEARREAPSPAALASRSHSCTTKAEQPRTALGPLPPLAGGLAGSVLSSVSKRPPAGPSPQVGGSWHANFTWYGASWAWRCRSSGRDTKDVLDHGHTLNPSVFYVQLLFLSRQMLNHLPCLTFYFSEVLIG